MGTPGGSVVKNLPADAGDSSSVPGLVRSPGEGNGNPLQYSCLENFMNRGAWWATVHRVAKSQTRLSDQRLSIPIKLVKYYEPMLLQFKKLIKKKKMAKT